MEHCIRILARDGPYVAPLLEAIPEVRDGFDIDTVEEVTSVSHNRDLSEYDCLLTGFGERTTVDAGMVQDLQSRFPSVSVLAVVNTDEGARAALNAGAVDVIQTQGGTVEPAVLENRIKRIVGSPARSPAGCRLVDPRAARNRDISSVNACSAMLDAVSDGVYLLDTESRFVALNQGAETLTGYDAGELLGQSVSTVIDEDEQSEWDEFRRQLREGETEFVTNELELLRKDGTTIPIEVRVASYELDGEHVGTAGVFRDITRRKEYERRLKCQHERLGLLNQFNSVLRQVSRRILDSSSRADLERTVCEQLAAVAPYSIATIGDVREGFHPREWAGIEAERLETFFEPLDGQTDEIASQTAVRTGTAQIINADDHHPSAECLDNETVRVVESLATIPIYHEEVNYGALALYAAEDRAFDEMEVRMLEELGQIVGHAINRLESRRLLVSDSVVELTFRISDQRSFFASCSAEENCTIALDSIVPKGDRTFLYYHTVTGGSPDQLLELAAESPMIETAEILSRHANVSRVVFSTQGPSIAEYLASRGATVKRAKAKNGVTELVVEVAPEVDIESIQDAIESLYADYELVSKREQEREVLSLAEFRKGAGTALTDRQRAALEAAYFSGYFERPRKTNATAVAAQMDISSSTFHQHLRVGHKKVLSMLFESSPDVGSPANLAAEPKTPR